MQRLAKRAQFQAVLSGKRIATSAHFALHQVPLDMQTGPGPSQPDTSPSPPILFAHPDVWLGAMAPKRWAKRAVTRNAIKRQIYSVSSDFESALPHAAYVVRLRAVFDRAIFPSATSPALKRAVREELQQLFATATRAGDSRPLRAVRP